jgi:hypothetical protein
MPSHELQAHPATRPMPAKSVISATGPKASRAAIVTSPRIERSSQHAALLQLQRQYGNRYVGLFLDRMASGHAMPLSRQVAAGAGTPGGPDPCLDLLQQIIELLNEVATRFNNALDDPHDLFRNHRTVGERHPDYGSWDGHRDRFYYDRGRLRHKLAEWESNDDCRGYRLSRQQQEEMNEAQDFKEREFPERPAGAMREAESGPGLRERVAEGLKEAGIPAWAVAGLVVLVIAALADPEPFTKVALLIGAAAAVALFIFIGRRDDVPPTA